MDWRVADHFLCPLAGILFIKYSAILMKTERRKIIGMPNIPETKTMLRKPSKKSGELLCPAKKLLPSKKAIISISQKTLP